MHKVLKTNLEVDRITLCFFCFRTFNSDNLRYNLTPINGSERKEFNHGIQLHKF